MYYSVISTKIDTNNQKTTIWIDRKTTDKQIIGVLIKIGVLAKGTGLSFNHKHPVYMTGTLARGISIHEPDGELIVKVLPPTWNKI